jgi:ATP-dependent protease ClpP protease subunit
MHRFATFIIIILLSSNSLARSISDYGVQLGSSTRQTLERLGQPSLKRQLNGFTVHGYCLQAGLKVDGQTLVFENDILVWTQGFKTQCGQNFRLREIDWEKVAREKLVSEVKEEYLIDDLTITVSKSNLPNNCFSGNKYQVNINGMIGPDSTFAVGKLIDQREPCTDASGEVISPIEVTLESGGGYLDDGYKLGKVFRDRGVTTIISDDKMCASSCAVAFLGGTKRFVADKGSILFHAPYLKQMQLEGKERITCDLPKEELQALNDYYKSMTSDEVGDRLFERTMWYCSAENGWTITGGAAAELYGVATEANRRTNKKDDVGGGVDVESNLANASFDLLKLQIENAKNARSRVIGECVLNNAGLYLKMEWSDRVNLGKFRRKFATIANLKAKAENAKAVGAKDYSKISGSYLDNIRILQNLARQFSLYAVSKRRYDDSDLLQELISCG